MYLNLIAIPSGYYDQFTMNYSIEGNIIIDVILNMTNTTLMLILLFMLWKILLRIYPPGDIEINLELDNHYKLSKSQYLVIVVFVC